MENLWEFAGTALEFLFGHLFWWNIIFAVIIVFFQRKDPKSVWAWLLLLFFIPFLGFVFYLVLGVDMHKRKMFQIKELEDHVNEAIRRQESRLKSRKPGEDSGELGEYMDLVMYNLLSSEV